jgi:hypothetical protein
MDTYFNNGFRIKMTKKQALSISHPGDCLKDVKRLLQNKEYKKQFNIIPENLIKKELLESGGWEEFELADTEENLQRITWIAGCNIKENINLY